jgi:chromosome partitioning protein
LVRRIAFVNEKGGSCKTTLTVHMGAYLASVARSRVLLIDLDPQGQLGKTLGYDVASYKRTTLELLLDDARSPSLFLRRTRIPNLDVVLSNKSIALFPTLVAGDPDRDRKLLRAIERLEEYDYILFDSPASFGTIMMNILMAAGEVVVPVNATFLALDGCAELVRTLDTLKDSAARAPELRLIVPTLYRPTRMADSVVERLHAHFPGRVYPEPLRYDVKIDEAQSHGQTIWEYEPRARVAEMLTRLGAHLEGLGASRAERLRPAPPEARPAVVDLRGRSREA